MEIKSEDIEAFLSHQKIAKDSFGCIFQGHIPANNSYGFKERDVAIRVSHSRTPDDEANLQIQFRNELKLCSVQHRNIIGLIGFCETEEKFYLVYELVKARPLSEVIEGLTWEQALKVLKGTVAGLAYLHGRPDGALVHCNISSDSIVVTEEFVPKIIDFRYCVVEGQLSINGNPRYYHSKQGIANLRADMFAFGLVALQLITKDSRSAFSVDEGVSLHHILELYMPMFKEKGNLVHVSYGQEKESRKLTEMIVDCMKTDSQVTLKSFHKDLILLSLAKQL